MDKQKTKNEENHSSVLTDEESKVNQKLKEWIDSNRKDKTRIKFEFQDKYDPNVSYSWTLGQLFDTAFNMGERAVLAKVEKMIENKIDKRIKYLRDGSTDIRWIPHAVTELDSMKEELKQELRRGTR